MLLRSLAVAVALAAAALAQELRTIDTPLFGTACFDPFRARVIAHGAGGYSFDWDGTVWRQATDAGAPAGFRYVGRSDRRLRVVRSRFVTGVGIQFDMFVRTDNTWQSVSSTGAPPLRLGGALAYDSSRDELLLFGGNSGPVTFGDTWIWNGVAWAQQPVSGPSPRTEATVAFDSVRQRVVLFGGNAVPFQPTFADTWEWHGAGWTQVPATNPPPPRLRAVATYDPARQRVVMIGPAGGVGFPVEHWEYDGAGWTQPGPLPTTTGLDPVIVHDEARGETLLLGGFGAAGRHGRVFAWNGSSWSVRAGFGELPSHSFGTPVARQPNGDGLLLFGPRPDLAPTNELWTFDAGGWSLTDVGGPVPRSAAAMWTMPTGAFLFGGHDGVAYLGDTWRWDGATWSQLTPTNAPPARREAAVAYDSAAGRAVLFGGRSDPVVFSDTWLFDGAQWQQATGPMPPARTGAALAYDPVRNRTVLFGGLGGPSGITPLTDTWQWNGSAWQPVVTAAFPPRGGSMAFDPVGGCIVCCAPSANIFAEYQAWSFDGVAWTPRPMVGTAGSANALSAALPRTVTSQSGRVFVVDQQLGVLEMLATPARAVTIGAPCGPDPLTLTAAALPRPGTAAFAIEVTGVPPNGPVSIAGAEAPAALPFFGCTLLLARNQAGFLRFADAGGFVSFGLPVPPNPTLVGLSLWFQAAALAPSSPNGFTLSAGLRIDVGQ